jgi:hypothetical protein
VWELLESEVSQLRAENDALRNQLSNIQTASAQDDQIGRSVVDIRQHLLKALDAVNSLDGGSPSHSPIPTSSDSTTPPSTTSTYKVEGQDLITTNPYPPKQSLVQSGNLHTLAMPSQARMESSISPIPYPTHIPSYNQQSTPRIIEPPYDPTCCGGLLDCSDRLPPLQLPITDPRRSAPPPLQHTGMAYDEECCGGVFDCSDLPLVNDGMAVEDVDRRGISHCRAER